VHPDEDVVRLDVDDDVVRVTTARGATFETDHVLAGIGVEPRLDLAIAAGLDCDGGVCCDRFLQASEPHVYAIGDICEYESVVHGGRRMRIEHWDVARSQGAYVGRRIAGAIGELEPYDAVPYFFSQLGDWAFMRYVGPGMGDVVIRGDLEAGSFSAAYLGDDGQLVALLAVDHDEDLDAARELLPRHPRLDRARLGDDAVPLRELVLG
jgi:3-phenylpropionate/trans-cinnamate dioxygenase ferredoxin reductase component